jgi:hypothetical protein
MARLKRIGVISLGTTFGLLYTIVGFIFGAFISLVSLSGIEGTSGTMGMFFGNAAVLSMPVIYGVMGPYRRNAFCSYI